VRRVAFILLAVVVVVAAAIALGVALDGSGSEDAGPAASTRSTTTTTAPPTTTTTRGRRGSGQPVTFAFGGDVHFEGSLRSKLDANAAGMLGPIAPELQAADVAMVNLETAITERGSPEPKEYDFRAPATAFTALQGAGVDVVTMANNHGVDYGPEGLQDSLAAKAGTPVGVVGIGANATEAYAPWTRDIKGQRVSVIGASDVIDNALIPRWTATDAQGGIASAKGADQARLIAAVQAARPNADTLVVYLHWGEEGATCPTPRQQELAQALVAAGADIVVGSHAHRVLTAGRLGTALVDYGLGNFIFYNESGLSGVTGVLSVTATGRDIDAYAWKPARIRGGVPQLLDPSAAASDLAGFDARRSCTNLTP
jgi:poly-gamma-glutamate synthesis protein (capsule biosynthesis protein)